MSKLDKKLSNLIWSDSSVKKCSYDSEKDLYLLEIVDYQNQELRVSFSEIKYSFIDDPVYISNAKFHADKGFYISEFFDDDGLVIKLVYLSSELMYL